MLASGLESAVQEARAARPRALECVPLCKGPIRDAQDDLLQLAQALRSPARCRPHAAALVSFLVCDAPSPLYHQEARATPAQLARAAKTGFAATRQ